MTGRARLTRSRIGSGMSDGDLEASMMSWREEILPTRWHDRSNISMS
jgi:hypothetical protein